MENKEKGMLCGWSIKKECGVEGEKNKGRQCTWRTKKGMWCV
jgi:hypothetical protein